MSDMDAVVIGAGVVGLATARALAIKGLSVLLLEGEEDFGSWTSSRNSEVIHAGLYYSSGSLKAQLCLEGKHQLYEFCEARSVPHRRTGKLIFAADEGQIDALHSIQHQALENGVNDLVLLDRHEVRDLEPALNCIAALLSPSTGIVDIHSLMLALLGEAEANGAMYVSRSRVARVKRRDSVWQIYLEDCEDPAVSARCIVNAAGLAAQSIAASIEGLDAAHIPPSLLARGIYFSYSGKVPFSRLIYPLPEAGGLGLHLTLDMGGQARFGPDVEWIDRVDYTVNENRKPAFVAAARRIWSGIDPDKLLPGYAGIRPKIVGPGAPAADFMISGPVDHGCDGLVNLFGIESPGLTASLAIADRVVEALR